MNRGKDLAKSLRKVNDWCFDHPNQVLEICCTGDRSTSRIDRCYLAWESVFYRFKFGHFLRAAIYIGLYVMVEKEKEMEFSQNGERRVQLFTNAHRWIEEVLRRVGMRRVEVPDGTDIGRWLQDHRGEVFLVWLNGTMVDCSKIDHAVGLITRVGWYLIKKDSTNLDVRKGKRNEARDGRSRRVMSS